MKRFDIDSFISLIDVFEKIKTAENKCLYCSEELIINYKVGRDHHYNNTEFNNIKEDDIIQVKIVGMRFELNDTYVSVIAELI